MTNFWITGKTVLITGANTGIGKETAIALAEMDANIIMVCRNKMKGDQARNDIIESTGNQNIELLICDLSSLHDVKRFTEEFLNTHSELHVLINNAGVFKMKREVSKDGYELQFAVNYLAHFYLTNQLLPLLKQNSPSRIVNLSSDMHKFLKIKLNDIMLETKYSGQRAYSNSKTAMVLLTNKLARDLSDTEVSVFAVNPGHAKTQMTTEGLPKWFKAMSDLFPSRRTVAQAATSSIFAASDDSLNGMTGKYFTDKKETKTAKMTKDPKNQDYLWEMSIRLVAEIIK